MRIVFLVLALFSVSFLIAQEGTGINKIVTPPEVVKIAFEKEYPGKVPFWADGYDKNDEIRYRASFYLDNRAKAFAIYDALGNMKGFIMQIPISQLPLKAQTYLKKNYEENAIKDITIIVDDDNNTCYEVVVEKNSEYYDIQFYKNGDFNMIVPK